MRPSYFYGEIESKSRYVTLTRVSTSDARDSDDSDGGGASSGAHVFIAAIEPPY